MKLKNKIMLAFLAIGLLPLAFFGYLSLHLATVSLEEEAFKKLEAVREIKETQIEEYFEQREADIVMLEHAVESLIFKDTHSKADEIKAAEANQGYFDHFIKAYGYDDLLLIKPDGDVFYSVEKLSDYQTNLITGPFSRTGLGRIFSKTLPETKHNVTHIEDFSPYPANNNKPEAFISAPILVHGKLDSVLVLKLSIDHINELMQQRGGMGETGESYLVGSDHKMRSDSFLDPINHTVAASFAGTVAKNGVNSDAVNAALAGETDSKIVIDYNGNPVLSAYAPLKLNDLKWVLLAEIDEAEALIPVVELRNIMLIVIAITALIVVFIAMNMARSITRPIGGEPDKISKIAHLISEGNLTSKFDQATQHSGIYGSMQKMNKQLNMMIGNINQMSHSLASGASQSSVASEQVNVSLLEQQASIESVSTAMNEMSVTIQDVSSNAQHVAESSLSAKNASAQAKNQVTKTIDTIASLSSELGNAKASIQTVDSKSQEIGAILEVIRGIADQTNLLALNAAIEAARAGDQGRGFSVVADEVRQLAQKTQLSTSDIENMINLLQEDVKQVVNVINRSNDIAERSVAETQETEASINLSFKEAEVISLDASQIATAAMQQSAASEEINQALVTINEAAKQNSMGMGEISESSSHISSQSKKLKALSDEFEIA
ncbi:chemotaxis protein [Marinomonas sp. S3726]|uniref:methyl-accepting chemotaxis protein n=1 Tax=Marinomonas sp. S3726 TaxID=579484 RepID=UPI0005FA1FC3|nr:methyl-accepting chemotaxis protein [Marinomonas sp. S3726]KJZ11516.1 chemotaxis protein [Marinomonas sp. S3726]